jgi:hypothetical protein
MRRVRFAFPEGAGQTVLFAVTLMLLALSAVAGNVLLVIATSLMAIGSCLHDADSPPPGPPGAD